MAKRAFTVEQLEEWGLPYNNLHEELEHGGGRWYDYMKVVFEAPDDGLAYMFYYQVGKTESQDCYWEEGFPNGIVEATRVELVPIVIETSEWREV